MTARGVLSFRIHDAGKAKIAEAAGRVEVRTSTRPTDSEMTRQIVAEALRDPQLVDRVVNRLVQERNA